MKVSDFVASILKMFNLTAFSENESVYTLEQLENWYFQGQIKNLTEYTITDLEFERIKPYKKINFEYERSESFMNRNFFDSGAREYGNVSTIFNTDGNDYTIKLPFVIQVAPVYGGVECDLMDINMDGRVWSGYSASGLY